ncbi:S8 family serine peptidase [Halomarina salina]|uniref:S8 family serine peptidase n=1 Tax=Halomarina salina TaxID=1872699 RepID=A0ABD5RJE5_9EURY|nr:S8 family serine peptidase [Halomarina salina]
MDEHSRRRFLRLVGAAGAGVALGTVPVAAAGERERFLIDLQEVDRSAVPGDVDIVHDLSAIDVLVAAGDPESVGGAAATAPDVALNRHDDRWEGDWDGDDDDHGHGGPAREHHDDDDDEEEEPKLPDYRSLQWDKHSQELEEEVHEETRGRGSRLAVIDSGVADHPDLRRPLNERLSKNFTDDGENFRPNGAGDHGTHVAGIVAGTDDYRGPRGGILGTAPKTDLLALRVFSSEGGAATGDVMAALMYAADKRCDAANVSLGFPLPFVYPDEYPELLTIKTLYERAVSYANERGTVVVNSAGNDALDMDPESVLSLPTEAEGVFAVSATGPIGYLWDDEEEGDGEWDHDEDDHWDRDDDDHWDDDGVDVEEALEHLRQPTTQPAIYTNYGGDVLDVSAEGGNYDPEAYAEANDGDDDNPKWYYDLVVSTVTPNDDGTPGYGWKAGTSMAAPQVTGAVGLVRSLAPRMGVREVEELVRSTASDLGDPDYHGDGHLDLTALVDAAEDRDWHDDGWDDDDDDHDGDRGDDWDDDWDDDDRDDDHW